MEEEETIQNNKTSFISVVLGILGIVFSIVSAFLNLTTVFLVTTLIVLTTIILSHKSLKKFHKSKVVRSGKGVSIVSLILGYTALMIIILTFVVPLIITVINRLNNPPNHEFVFLLEESPEKIISQNLLVRSEKILSNRLEEIGAIYEIRTIHPDTLIVQLNVEGNANINSVISFITPGVLSFHLLKDTAFVTDLYTSIDEILKGINEDKSHKNKTGDATYQSLQDDENVNDYDLEKAEFSKEKLFQEGHPFFSLITYIERSNQWIARKEIIDVIDSILQLPEINRKISSSLSLLWGLHPIDKENIYFELYCIDKKPRIVGSHIDDADYELGIYGDPIVLIEMNKEGTREFARLTGANIGNRLAIVLDDKVLSTPTITSKISGGRIQITGISQLDEAREITVSLRSGAFPVPLKYLEMHKLINEP